MLAENWPIVELFLALQTQWRLDYGRATGLDYQAVETVMRLHSIKRAHRAERFTGIRIMELAALKEWSGLRKEATERR